VTGLVVGGGALGAGGTLGCLLSVVIVDA